MGQGRARFTNKERIEVLKRWACDENVSRREMGADLGVPPTLVSNWISDFLNKDQALYQGAAQSGYVWDRLNKRAGDDVLSTPDDYWSPPKRKTWKDDLPKQTANITKLNGGVLCVFDSCTISEMNRILCAIGAL